MKGGALTGGLGINPTTRTPATRPALAGWRQASGRGMMAGVAKAAHLSGTKVSDAGVKKLQQASPNCVIWR